MSDYRRDPHGTGQVRGCTDCESLGHSCELHCLCTNCLLNRLGRHADTAERELAEAVRVRKNAEANYVELHRELARLRKMVNEQAEDDGLWFCARTAPEAYLQQELRKLHAAIEEIEIDE